MSKTTKTVLLITLLVLVVGIYYFKQPKTASGEPIKLGFVAPLSGDGAAYGIDEKNAAAMAVKEINEAGGIKGRPIEVIYEDGRCTGKDAATAAQKLINIDKVKIILGGACSAETLAIAPIAEQSKVILFSSFSSNPDISKAGDYVFRNSPSDLDVAKGYAQYIIKEIGYKKIAIISENTDYARGAEKVFVDEVKNLGGEIVAAELFKQAERDFRGNITRIKAANPETIFINPQSGVTAGLALKQIRELSPTTPVFSVFVFSGKDAQEAAGTGVDNLIFFDFVGLNSENGKKFLDRFVSVYGKPGGNDYSTGARYDTIYIIANGLKKCGEDTSCIKDYLYDLKTYDGTVGRYNFDKNGDMVGIVPLTPKFFRNGKIELYNK